MSRINHRISSNIEDICPQVNSFFVCFVRFFLQLSRLTHWENSEYITSHYGTWL